MEQQFGQLKLFVDLLKKDPSILHHPGLTFFREYIESLGGNIPEAKQCPFGEAKPEAKAESKPEKKPSPPPAAEPMEAETEPEPEIPYPELDNEGVIQPDSGEALPMGDTSKEASEEEIEKAQEERNAAQEAFSNGEFDKALEHFTTAIQLNPGSAMLHAKRANCLLKLKRPVSAIADCTKAIEINADSAQGYKFRGRAHRLLGNWLDAHKDLATACKLDYDDTANEWLKEVEPNVRNFSSF
ncbi:unnamed protein product, partial [Mesorhabditis belari]|uniref:Hsp70-interacting protein N-terminal domain-containing protein n=1 Tax=Mesorhabditis belari TaxID=2138241 RepID=A0AAF3EAH1_9BILA